MRHGRQLYCTIAAVLLGLSVAAQAQTPANSPMKFITWSGALPMKAAPAGGAYLVTFAIYAEESGGAPLWQEIQNVSVDVTGHYTVQLGTTTSGFPADLFPSNEPRWLGIQPQGEPEQPRIRLVSVPYAIKAGEADTLSGHSASEFVTTEALQSTVQQQLQQQMAAPAGVASSTGGPNTAVVAANGALASTSFVDTNDSQVVSVQQNGTGVGVSASAPANSAIVGTVNGAPPTGVVAAVEGVSSLDGSFGLYGQATSASVSNPGIGVHGQSDSPNGTGLEGVATGSGNTVGILARVNSPNAVGALVINAARTGGAGPLIKAQTNQGVQFMVDGSGNLNARGSLSSLSFVRGTQLISTAPNGIPPFQINSTTAIPNLNAGLLGGLPSSGFIQNSLTAQSNTNFNIDGQGTIGTSAIIGSSPSVNGQVAVIRDDLDYIHSVTGQAGQQMHFRVSSAQPGGGGSKDFLIVPYTYGMAMEYAGVLEAWVDDFSVHNNHRNLQYTGARFWVGDESDLGGLFVTSKYNSGPPSSYVNIAADKFDHTSHGNLQFQLRDPTDTYNFQWGPYRSEVTRATFNATTDSSSLYLRNEGGATGAFTVNANSLVALGSVTPTPVGLVIANRSIETLFPDGNVSIGNILDSARLSVGSGAFFQVDDAGNVAATNLTANAISANSFYTSNLTSSGPVSASEITASGTVTANAVHTGALTASAINSNSVTTPALNVTSATAATVSANHSMNNSLTLGNGTAIVGHLSTLANLTFGAIPANSCQTRTASLPGASDGDTVVLGIPNILGAVDGITWFAWVSAADTVSVRGCNATLMATASPPPAAVRIDVWKH